MSISKNFKLWIDFKTCQKKISRLMSKPQTENTKKRLEYLIDENQRRFAKMNANTQAKVLMLKLKGDAP